MKRVLLIVVFMLWALLLSGRLQEPRHVFPVVEKVELYTHHGVQNYRYVVEDPIKISEILNYLRANRSIDTTDQIPLVLPKNSYTVKVHLSDHKYHIYQQVEYRYLRKDNGPWMRLRKKQAVKLKKLEKSLVADRFFPAQKLNF